MVWDELKKRGIAVDHRETVTSTNSLVQQALLNGQDQPLLMIANQQSAGHGKLGRHFYSATSAGAYFTLGLPAAVLPDQWQPQRLTIQAVVAAYQAVRKQFASNLTIKWVNDLYRDSHKVAGILAETAVDHRNQLRGVVIGWGINLSVSPAWPAELKHRAGAVSDQPVTEGQREQLVTAVVARFCALQAADWATILNTYRRHQYLAGRELTVTLGPAVVSGRFAGITDQGYLLVQTASGPKSFSAGTVRLKA